MQERLQKIIARAGVASRRAGEEMILAGRVRVNGTIVNELGAKADLFEDKIEVDGVRLVAESPRYILLHKPRNVVSTLDDPEGRPTVADLLRDVGGRVYPVGRLDFATSGVLLITNDGEFANALLHPRGGVPKTYVLKVHGNMGDEDVIKWATGVQLDDGLTLPADVRIIRHEDDKTWLEVTLREGRNQQIRRMGEATGFPVMRLARMSFAGISSESLRPGEWRPLSVDELLDIRKHFGVPKKVRMASMAGPVEKPGRHGHDRTSRSERHAASATRIERMGGGGSPTQRGAPRAPRAIPHAERGGAPAQRGASRPDSRAARPDARATRTDNRTPYTDSRGPRTDTRGPRTDTRAPRTDTRAPRTDTRGPRTDTRGPRTDTRGPRTDSRAPRPDTRASRPDTRAARPDTRAAQPERGAANPRARRADGPAPTSRPRPEPRQDEAPAARPRRAGPAKPRRS
jgi:23S rRNA pseudouridine2605 synthase